MGRRVAHTPGPWRLLDQKLRPQFSVRILEVTGADGAPVVKWIGFDGLSRPKAETKANARLIAAAPGLLTAAQQTLAMLSACLNQSPDEWHALVLTPAGSWLPSAWLDLQAAIQEAGGAAE